MPSALILIADGTEEMEFTIVYDTLVRGGVKTTSAYVPESRDLAGQVINQPIAKCSRGVRIVPDIYFDSYVCGPDTYDLLVVPGGAKGAETISNDISVQALIRRYIEHNKFVGMICAGSLAAKTAGLKRQPLTSHPSVRAELEHDFEYEEKPVIISDKLVTSRGPGTAFPFAFILVELLCGSKKMEEIRGPMVFPQGTPF